jgi:hypothetical protein
MQCLHPKPLINIETFHDIPSQSSDNLQCIDPRLINISAWSQRRHFIITAPKKGSTSHLLYIFENANKAISGCDVTQWWEMSNKLQNLSFVVCVWILIKIGVSVSFYIPLNGYCVR